MAVTHHVVIDDEAVLAGFERIRGQGVPGAIHAAGQRSGARVAAMAKAGTPVGSSGLLRRSITFRQLVVDGSPAVIVGSPLLHALVIHEGRRPGQRPPPPGALTEWLRYKGIDPRMEYVIAKTIGQKGFDGRPFLRDAFEASKAAIMADYKAAFAQVFAS